MTLCHSGYEHMAHECCEIVEAVKQLNLDGHILYLEGYIRIQPVNYDKGKLETILWDLKELQKFVGQEKK